MSMANEQRENGFHIICGKHSWLYATTKGLKCPLCRAREAEAQKERLWRLLLDYAAANWSEDYMPEDAVMVARKNIERWWLKEQAK